MGAAICIESIRLLVLCSYTSDSDHSTRQPTNTNSRSRTGAAAKDEDGYVEVTRHKRRPLKLGTAEALDGDVNAFSGGPKRVWINIYRVNKTATEEIIRDYVKKKAGLADMIVVKEIPKEGATLKSFLVVAPLAKKDELYDTAFWPKYVGIRRFSFDRNRDFLESVGDLGF